MRRPVLIIISVLLGACGDSGEPPAGISSSPAVVSLMPERPSLFAGDTLHLRLVLLNVNGDTMSGTAAVTWTSVGAAASVSGGIVTGLSAGSATVTASVAGLSNSVDVVVLPRTTRANRELSYTSEMPGTCAFPRQVRLLNSVDTTSTPMTGRVCYIDSHVWSRDGSKVAVSYISDFTNPQSRSGIWVQNPDGSSEAYVGFGLRQSWSPDGTQLVFGGGDDLFVGMASGGSQSLLARAGVDDEPDWSPDGRSIVFTHAPRELWTIRPDGSGARLLYRATTRVSQPRWSPDGKYVAFLAGLDTTLPAAATSGGVWIIGASGIGLQPVSANCGAVTCTLSGSTNSFDWFPDGRKLVYSVLPVTNGGPYQFVVATLPTVTRQPILQPSHPSAPMVSPDGTLLTFSDNDPAQPPQNWRSVFVVGVNGQGARVLTRGDSVGLVRWRP